MNESERHTETPKEGGITSRSAGSFRKSSSCDNFDVRRPRECEGKEDRFQIKKQIKINLSLAEAIARNVLGIFFKNDS